MSPSGVMTGNSPADTIFISIAAYRDPELLPTIADCLAKAREPDRLRFGICWQHGPGDAGSERLASPQFAVQYVDWQLSKGACWARAEVMKLYNGEDWYLQLDSHHRFAADWDAKLIEQAALTDSAKPVLSTYAAAYTPGAESDAAEQVTTLALDRFTPDGLVLLKPAVITHTRAVPPRARFVSAHFLFAPGTFVRDVPYDPELYFLGEEITLAIRAFTHGYDLFHPARHILWHEYTRANRAKHWDDHTHEGGIRLAWHERDAVSRAKVRRFLTEPWPGRDGIGGARSAADYEAYAGISFRHCRIQDYTRLDREPPNPVPDPYWAERLQDHKIEIRVERDRLPPAALDDPSFWYVGVHDSTDQEIYRHDAQPAELAGLLASSDDSITMVRQFCSERTPASWTVWPHSASRGWLEPVTGPIRAEQRIFVSIASYRDPDLVSTILDCLAKASHPDRLRFVICWQHGPEERLPEWVRGPQFHILDINWHESRGACWARAAIMEHWAGEDWFLQIDSHQRFAPQWDTTLITQATLTGSHKPLLSSPAPPFTIGTSPTFDQPLGCQFTGFRDNGIPQVKIGLLPLESGRETPVRARSVCGHFIFAPGTFTREVPYDPEMYFSSEETTMAVRAFTHGYDLFHPAKVVTWHEYEGSYRSKHWHDHPENQGAQSDWHQLHERGIAKVIQFFTEPDAGGLGLGRERTFADYESYAGVSFGHRCVQDYTRLNREPPNPPADPGWASQVRHRKIAIALDVSELSPAATEANALWYVGVHDGEGRELYRQDASPQEVAELLAAGQDHLMFVRQFSSEAVPASWTVLPLSASAGWLEPIVHTIGQGSTS
jgi:Glycosyltransferase (GlcNAc)